MELYLLVLTETQFRKQFMDSIKMPHSKAVSVHSGVMNIGGQDVLITGSGNMWVVDLNF